MKKRKWSCKTLSTGKTLTKSEDDKDYVVWNYVIFWKKITHFKRLTYGRIVQISGKPDSGKIYCGYVIFMKCAQDQDILVILWEVRKSLLPIVLI